MKALVLYSAGGGSSMGYHREGFTVLGIDHIKKRDYPFEQIKADIPSYIESTPLEWFRQFDLISAHPPCQMHSITRNLAIAQGNRPSEVEHIGIIRPFLQRVGVPYVIENVVGAPLEGTILCGSSFGLGVRRHRIFESSFPIEALPCHHREQGRPIGVYGALDDEIPGGGKTAETVEQAREAMGIEWLNWGDLKQSIPPAYTQHVARCFKKSRLLA